MATQISIARPANGVARGSPAGAVARPAYAQMGLEPAAIHASKPVKLTAEELALMFDLEGRAWPTPRQLAGRIQQPIHVARTMLERLRNSGLCRVATVVRPDPDQARFVAYLKLDLLDMGAVETLERRLAANPDVITAARLSGEQDCRIETAHADLRAADRWFRELLTDVAVREGALTVTRTVFSRIDAAASLAKPQPREGALCSRRTARDHGLDRC